MGLEVREGCLARAGLGAETWMATSGDYVPPAGKAQATSAPLRALPYLARRSGQKWPEPCPHLCHLSPHEGLIAQLLVTPMVLSYKWGDQGPGQLSHPGARPE